MVVQEVFTGLFLTEILEGVSPQDIAHEALSRGLPETINLNTEDQSAQFVEHGIDTAKYVRFENHPEYEVPG